MKVAACLKWVALRPDIDPLTGAVGTDDRFSGVSVADQAALEWALRMGSEWDVEVTVATVGRPASEVTLRDALACGAHVAVRVDAAPDLSSIAVANELALILDDVDVIMCGDWSLDRGSGSVPAFLAHARGAAQACGLVGLALEGPGVIRAERRLDGGRRERILVRTPAVLSVEGATARLRRAPLAGVLAAAKATIGQRVAATVRPDGTRTTKVGPFSPRTKIIDAPIGSVRDRSNALLGMGSTRTPSQRLVLDPEAAADRILASLREWGELEPDPNEP